MEQTVLRILKLSITGFRGIKGTFYADCDDINEIIARNHGGKTSINHALIWCLSGFSKDGDKKDLDLVNHHCSKAQVIITLTLNEEIHLLERSLTTNGYHAIKWDNCKITQKELNQIIDPKIVLAANPFFLLKMDASKAREVILGESNIQHVDVLNKLGYIPSLSEEEINNPKTLRRLRKEVNSVQEEIKALECEKASLEKYLSEVQEESSTLEIEKQIQEVKQQKLKVAEEKYEAMDLSEVYRQQRIYQQTKEGLISENKQNSKILQIQQLDKKLEQIKTQMPPENTTGAVLEAQINTKKEFIEHLKLEASKLKLKKKEFEKNKPVDIDSRKSSEIEKEIQNLKKERDGLLKRPQDTKSIKFESEIELITKEISKIKGQPISVEVFDEKLDNKRKQLIEIQSIRKRIQEKIIQLAAGEKHFENEANCPYCGSILTGESKVYLNQIVNRAILDEKNILESELEGVLIKENSIVSEGSQLLQDKELEIKKLIETKNSQVNELKTKVVQKQQQLEQIKKETIISENERNNLIKVVEQKIDEMTAILDYQRKDSEYREIEGDLIAKRNLYESTCQEGSLLVEKLNQNAISYQNQVEQFQLERENHIAILSEKIRTLKIAIEKENEENQKAIAKIDRALEDLQLNKLIEEDKMNQEKFIKLKNDRIKGIDDQLIQLEKEYQYILLSNKEISTLISNNDKVKKDIKKVSQKMEKLMEECSISQKGISEITDYIRAKSQVFNEKLNLPNTQIILEKISQENGELTTCFEVIYNDKDNGPLTQNKWSTSEEIAIGKELSEMLLRLFKVKSFITVDCAESISYIPESEHQIFTFKVNDQSELSILSKKKESLASIVA